MNKSNWANARFCADRALLPVLVCLAGLPAQLALAQAPTVTYRVAVESSAGMDGGVAWQSVFLLNDGRIASFGTGNHAAEQSNAVRIIDPVSSPGKVSSYDLFPWTQSGGVNLYVSNYDNHASIYIPSENKAIWVNHGVFDFAARSWTFGNRAPNTQPYTAFLDTTAIDMSGAFNPAVAWCSTLDKGVWYGNSGGGYGPDFDSLVIVERSGAAKPWKLTKTNLGAAYRLGYARNSAVCIGENLYVGGPQYDGATSGPPRFFKINVATKTVVATLAPFADVGDYFPQMVYDSARQRIVLIGKRVQEYNLTANAWTDITPTGWPGYGSPMGVYHPAINAIFFRGMPTNPGSFGENFEWHKMTFSSSSVSAVSPGSPTSLIAN